MLPHTIRGRLLLWIAALFGAILVGFGVTAFQLYRNSELSRIDDELERRVANLQADWRSSVPPGGGLGFGRGGRDGKRPPSLDGRMGPFSRGGPPDFDGPPRDFEDQLLSQFRLRLSDQTAALFPEEQDGFYYISWTRRGQELGRSANAPAGITFPEERVSGHATSRTRDIFREMYHVTEQGDCVLAGISTGPILAAQRVFAGWLTLAGAGILALGLAGGWIIIQRSLRPVHEIGAAAKRIADGALSERVAAADPRNELGALAAVLNSTFARLETAIADEKNFTANAAHELRTPLAVLLTETQRSLLRERTAADYRQTIEVCRDTTQEMKRLTESLLELARLDAGQELLVRAEFDLHAIAAAAAASVQPLAEARAITLTVEGSSTPAWGDADRLRQVAVNLLQNAIRYNRDAGSVRVATSTDATHAILTVSDTGVGIGAEDLPHVFKRFYRADRARSRTEGNSGLGLAICKAIVDSHRGTIEVASSPGAGTTFTVRIPLTAAS